MTDCLHVPDRDLAGSAVIYLRVGAARLAFDPGDLRDLVNERARMCGWQRTKEDDAWLIPDHIAMWYADRHKLRNTDEVIDRETHQLRVRDSQIDWWKEYDSPRG